MSKKYICYDVKGIQSFIFKIPKLKYIIGGSALIDQFDKETIPKLADDKCEHIFSGGGKGTFLCEESEIKSLREKIIAKAHDIGLDIRFGENEDFSQASQQTDELYSFVPDMNDGYPCKVSGMYPVKDGGEHSVLKKRIFDKKEKTYRYFENKLIKEVLHPALNGKEVAFFHNVNAIDGDEGKAGAESLGNRNRWAIISMDGNDMGMQFRYQVNKDNLNKLEGDELQSWIKNMSAAIDNCSTTAVSAGIQRVVSKWAESNEGKSIVNKSGDVILPIRPLMVGGDDIVVLCHISYAMIFVKEVIRVWEERSAKTAKLWPATNGKLTITAGVLYTSVTLPLHTAIPYSEALLASAKTRGRKWVDEEKKKQHDDNLKITSPACIDWEQITDSIIDTPAAKRQRELIFKDEELDNTRIRLTQRPYTIEEYKEIEKLAIKYGRLVPSSTRHKILPVLSKGYTERLSFYAEIKKNYCKTSSAMKKCGYETNLYEDLSEFEITNSKWQSQKIEVFDSKSQKRKNVIEQSTKIIDALMLLEEDTRMEKETN